MQDDWLRDPIWQFIGIIVSTIIGVVALIVTVPIIASIIVLIFLCAMGAFILYRIVQKRFAADHSLKDQDNSKDEDISGMQYRIAHKVSLQQRRFSDLHRVHKVVGPIKQRSLNDLIAEVTSSRWFTISVGIAFIFASLWLIMYTYHHSQPLFLQLHLNARSYPVNANFYPQHTPTATP